MYYQLPIDFATIREEMKEYMNVSREAVLNIPSNYTSKKDKIEGYDPFHISGQIVWKSEDIQEWVRRNR